MSDLSEHEISIDSKFSGKSLILFGAKHIPGSMVLLVKGPGTDYTIQKKKKFMGIWVSGKQVIFHDVPSYYMVAHTEDLAGLGDSQLLKNLQIGVDNVDLETDSVLNIQEEEEFKTALKSYLVDHKLIQDFPGEGFGFIDESLFRIPLYFPDTITRGTYTAELYLFDEGRLLAIQSTPLVVNRQGAEAFIFDFAHEYSYSYGIIAVVLALFCGGIANILFKKK
ncbi:MAG: TIGR02186 family protein [Alphaproteobacteria bacterium]|nr:TIGR02186 family protein [Alphaproteobacteria bacterium]